MAQTVISLASFKGGVGKSTLAVNLAGALALNAPTTLVDEDPLRSCYRWARRDGGLPMPVLLPEEARRGGDLGASRYLIVDTEGRPRLEELSELIVSSTWTLIPCGTSGLEIDGTLRLMDELQRAEADLARVKVVVTKAPPVGTVGQQARDALRAAGLPVANSVVRSYVAHQRAAELGVLVKDVPDGRAPQAWADVLELAMEVVG
ncbi:CobQ/CobB/MinD/ParA nucleotide binding domain (plasmid) [Rubrobacter radiotolerans]|uniref:CobQ/CobB/MinD/ParA nucleotide binding domain n=1 Tax=Rubrobacter radiotolerans TaxID=42256 RepID=A0A023X7J5_RUBRA|nr:ParA family protein [Rubrobacter radiotolerans]AHY48402.1 CobQ/CobB/MinD/ParA nucleotide binding domain [Rubrobacter radiotolerans]MDX5895624.1 ParA family protein [Rubrobacter radiotolerans]